MSGPGEQLPFFVYGTLRTGQINWEICLKGRTEREVPATLPGFALYATNIPYITATEEPGRVVGNLAFIKPEYHGQVLADLDDLEEYDPRTDSGPYRRVARPVDWVDGEGQAHRTRAWVYLGGPEALDHFLNKLAIATRIESGDWLNPGGREQK